MDDLLTLMAQARSAGLNIELNGDGALRVRGPKRLAPLVEQLTQQKDAIVRLLTHELRPTSPCYACKNMAWWQRPPEIGGGVVCAVCHPDPIRPVLEAAVPPLEGERKALFELAQSRGFPRLSFKAAHSVIGRAESWDVFSRTASDSDVRAARKALQARAESP